MKKIFRFFVIISIIFLSACSNEKETMSLEDAAVNMTRAINSDKLLRIDEQTDIHTFKDSVRKLRPYVDAFKYAKPKNKAEKHFKESATLFKAKEFMVVLDDFVKTAENGSAKDTAEFYNTRKTKEYNESVSGILWHVKEATEYSFGEIK